VASREDPAHRVRTLCGGTPQTARARQTGDLQLPGLHLDMWQNPRGQIPDPTEDPTGPHASEAQDGSRGNAAAYAPADPRSGDVAVLRRPWLLQLPRSADQLSGTCGIPNSDRPTLAPATYPPSPPHPPPSVTT